MMNPEEADVKCPTPSIFLSPMRLSTRSAKSGFGGMATAAAMASPAPSKGQAPSVAFLSPWRTPAKMAAAKGDVAAPVSDDDPHWTDASIVSVKDACLSGASVVVRVRVPPKIHQQYRFPAQYVKIRPQDGPEGETLTKPLFLAMSSPPPIGGVAGANANHDGPVFDFLVKRTPSNAWMIVSLSLSATMPVQISGVLGSGFPVDENLVGAGSLCEHDDGGCHPATQSLLLFAAGSGIGPIKAAIESGQLIVGPDGWTARLYYGERTEADLCFVDQFEAWEAMGYKVEPVLSQPASESWTGRTGYVQDAFEKDGVEEAERSGALVVGMKEMADAVKASLVSSGVFGKNVLFNY